MSLQGIVTGLVVLGAILFLARRFFGRPSQKPPKAALVPTSALLRKTRHERKRPNPPGCH